MELKITEKDIIHDIETEGQADEVLVRAITPPYLEFDPTAVKTANCKGGCGFFACT